LLLLLTPAAGVVIGALGAIGFSSEYPGHCYELTGYPREKKQPPTSADCLVAPDEYGFEIFGSYIDGPAEAGAVFGLMVSLIVFIVALIVLAIQDSRGGN
jgi:hypothetical protein